MSRYGEIYRIEEGKEAQAIGMGQGVTSKSGNRMHMTQQGPFLLSLKGIQSWDEESEQFKPVQSPVLDSLMAGKDWWPGMMATSSVHKETWMTGGDYKGLIVFRDNQLDKEKISMLKPLRDYAIRTLYLEQDGKAWIGGDFGLVEFNPACKDAAYSVLPKVRIRQIMINNEQLFYDGATGGKAELLSQPQIKFGSSSKEFDFVFSSDANNLLGQTRYSYYLEGYENTWRPWAMETAKEYTNLSFGKYTFHLKTIDSFGRESEEATFSFTILRPFYLKWYCWIAYVGIAILLLLLFFKWRTHQLRQKTQWLEGVVEERTKQIRDQRDEIAEKSEKLGETLNELKKAQSMLIRQEKVATVGKLTQGLIDRILNPLNYIINFSHLSNLLLKEMKEDLDDEEDRITEDNYDDMTEILGMLNTHLTKIEEHGNSTARILKAMEELLADHSCHFDRVDINKLITHNLTILKEYYQKEIKETGISFEVNLPDLPIEADVDKLLLGKVIMSILQNGIYALQRKKKKEAFDALLKIKLRQEGQLLRIELCDNGIGIESAILEKVFDPFFTTKTTAEAHLMSRPCVLHDVVKSHFVVLRSITPSEVRQVLRCEKRRDLLRSGERVGSHTVLISSLTFRIGARGVIDVEQATVGRDNSEARIADNVVYRRVILHVAYAHANTISDETVTGKLRVPSRVLYVFKHEIVGHATSRQRVGIVVDMSAATLLGSGQRVGLAILHLHIIAPPHVLALKGGVSDRIITV